MELRQLEAFVCVMECGSFSRAAERMYLGQPTVSAHIAALESELSVKLFMRTTKELYPTEEGRILYQYAQNMLSIRREALEAVRICACVKQGRVVVAASSIPVRAVLPKILNDFSRQYPHITLELHKVNSRGVVTEILERKAEIGFCGMRARNAKCSFEAIGEDCLMLITPDQAKYRKYRKSGFPVRLLEQERFISRESGSGTRGETELFLREMGLNAEEIHITAEYDTNEQIKDAVRGGRGVAILSRSVLRENSEGILSFEFNNIRLRRKLYILHRKNETLSPAAQIFYTFTIAHSQANKTGRTE